MNDEGVIPNGTFDLIIDGNEISITESDLIIVENQIDLELVFESDDENKEFDERNKHEQTCHC